MQILRLAQIVADAQPRLRMLDFVAGIASVGWGVYDRSGWWIGGGVLGLLISWWNPVPRLQRRIAFVRRPGAMPDAADPAAERRTQPVTVPPYRLQYALSEAGAAPAQPTPRPGKADRTP